MLADLLALLDKPVILLIVLAIGSVIGIGVERLVEGQKRAERRAYWAGRNANKRGSGQRKVTDAVPLKVVPDRAKLDAAEQLRRVMEADFHARALLNRPEVLLLDEPTASLDPDTADWVRRRLEQFRKSTGATVLLASHNMTEVERLCERVIIMKRGRIEDDDTPHRLLERYGRATLEDVFLDVARGRGHAAEAGR